MELRNLLIFFCHLFVSGKFNVGQFIFDSQSFDEINFIHGINQFCQKKISWLTFDLLEFNSTDSIEQNDGILQIIHLAESSLQGNLMKLQRLHNRLFVFFVNETFQFKCDFDENGIFSNSLIVSTHIKNGETKVYSISKDLEISSEPIYIQNEHSKENSSRMIFDATFGMYESRWAVGSSVLGNFLCKKSYTADSTPLHNEVWLLSNLYFTQLKLDFIEAFLYDCGDSRKIVNSTFLHLNHRNFYSDFHKNYTPVP